MKKLLMLITVLCSVNSFANDFRPVDCVTKVVEMNVRKMAGKAIPKNDLYRDAKARARAEFRSASLLDAKFERIYFLYSKTNAVIGICDDESGYEQGDCYEYYFNKKNNQVHLLAITKIPHIGKAKINFLCEGE